MPASNEWSWSPETGPTSPTPSAGSSALIRCWPTATQQTSSPQSSQKAPSGTIMVGVALASRGATASSETADVVLTVDRVDALADAILIAQRSKRIALQAVVLGMGLSLMAMTAAAAGLLPPAAGAVLQELIDVSWPSRSHLRAVLPGQRHTLATIQPDIATARS